MRTLLTERESELLAALRADLGKPPLEAYGTDIGFTINEIDVALKHLRSWTRTRTRLHSPVDAAREGPRDAASRSVSCW